MITLTLTLLRWRPPRIRPTGWTAQTRRPRASRRRPPPLPAPRASGPRQRCRDTKAARAQGDSASSAATASGRPQPRACAAAMQLCSWITHGLKGNLASSSRAAASGQTLHDSHGRARRLATSPGVLTRAERTPATHPRHSKNPAVCSGPPVCRFSLHRERAPGARPAWRPRPRRPRPRPARRACRGRAPLRRPAAPPPSPAATRRSPPSRSRPRTARAARRRAQNYVRAPLPSLAVNVHTLKHACPCQGARWKHQEDAVGGGLACLLRNGLLQPHRRVKTHTLPVCARGFEIKSRTWLPSVNRSWISRALKKRFWRGSRSTCRGHERGHDTQSRRACAVARLTHC